MFEIWFWHLIVSPHMADLVVALARLGCKVTYVARQTMSAERASQGWAAPALHGVVLQLADNGVAVKKLVQLAPVDSIHICQGVRANGLVGLAQIELAVRGLQQWVVMEAVNDSGWLGALRRMEYSRIFRMRAKSLQGVFATGHRTADWVVARGMPCDRVYPFAYFLPYTSSPNAEIQRKPGPFRLLFVGQLIPRKRVNWLINALAKLMDHTFELWVVGAGPEEHALRALAADKLGNRVRWLGPLSLSNVPSVMAQADCLVLPSDHDGWGAVVSEALMVGTPVICSDACGVAGVLQASGVGGVFPANDKAALVELLAAELAKGVVQVEARRRVADWATCLGADAGARYLLNILLYKKNINNAVCPVAPWQRGVL